MEEPSREVADRFRLRAEADLEQSHQRRRRGDHRQRREKPIRRLDSGQGIGGGVQGQDEQESPGRREARGRVPGDERGQQRRRDEGGQGRNERPRSSAAIVGVAQPPEPHEREQRERRFGQRDGEAQPEDEGGEQGATEHGHLESGNPG